MHFYARHMIVFIAFIVYKPKTGDKNRKHNKISKKQRYAEH